MITPAFSTVACPEWPLEAVFDAGKRWGFLGVELRTFGDGSRQFACDPALTDPTKIRGMAERSGLGVVSLATGTRFDARMNPPVVGELLGDPEAPVREAKRAIDLAASIECPLVRVFGFEAATTEKVSVAAARIAARLAKVVDHAHRTGVRVAIENGGSFMRSSELAGIIDTVASPLLGACYNVAAGQHAGESPEAAFNVLGDRLWSVRVKDLKAGVPCGLGEGNVPVRPALDRLASIGFKGPVIFEYDRAWITGLPASEGVLAEGARFLFAGLGARVPTHARG
ncbi:MAG: sugar phosphate isomerase/epimerase family protein [Phycisphaerales bacterium]